MDIQVIILVALTGMELGAALVLFRVPLELRLIFTISETDNSGRVVCLFGLFSLVRNLGIHHEGDGTEILVAGRRFPVFIPAKTACPEKDPGPGSTPYPGPGKPGVPLTKGSFQTWKRLIPLIPGILRAVRKWYRVAGAKLLSCSGSVQLTGGFDNPALTGFLFGILAAVRPLLGGHGIEVRMVPEFRNPGIAAGGTIRICIRYPCIALLSLLSLVSNPAVFTCIRVFVSGPPRGTMIHNAGRAGAA